MDNPRHYLKSLYIDIHTLHEYTLDINHFTYMGIMSRRSMQTRYQISHIYVNNINLTSFLIIQIFEVARPEKGSQNMTISVQPAIFLAVPTTSLEMNFPDMLF